MGPEQIDEKAPRAVDDGSDQGVERGDEPVLTGTGAVKPKVHFNIWAALGVQFSVTATPISLGAFLSLTIGLGGSAGYFWTFFVVGILQLFVCLSAAELASALPHSSGPAHWVVALGPPRLGPILGYIMGWVTNSGWFFICCSSALYPAQLTLALAAAVHPGYHPEAWHVYVLYCGFAMMMVTINLPRIYKISNYILSASIVTFNFTALFLLVSLLMRTPSKQSPRVVFLEFVNESGWPSDGTVFFIAILPAVTSLSSFDNACHLADEVETPNKDIPQVLMGSFGLSYITGLGMIIVYEFCNIDPKSLLDPVGGQPLVQLLVNGLGDIKLVIGGMALLIFCFYVAGYAAYISWSRLYWSFSRSGSLPLSKTMSKLSSRDSLPVRALVWNGFLVMAIGTISLGSTTALNAFLGAGNLCQLSALIASFSMALYRGRRTLDQNRWLNLGRWGTVIYWIALLWSVVAIIFLSFPLYLPVNPSSMNWTSVVFIGFAVLSGIYWLFMFSRRGVTNQTPNTLIGEI